MKERNQPGGNPGVNLQSIFHRCYLQEVAFECVLTKETKETIHLPLGLPRVVKKKKKDLASMRAGAQSLQRPGAPACIFEVSD